MPLGWIKVTNYDGSVFYAFEPTGETQWDRPEYRYGNSFTIN